MTAKQFFLQFKTKRKSLGLTQADAAAQCKVTPRTIINWEKERFAPRAALKEWTLEQLQPAKQ